MKRKIIKQGLGGYTIYLPKTWVENKGLTEQKEVEIIESENDLIIRSPKITQKETSIELTEDNIHDINVILTHAYRGGYDKITLKNVDDKSLSAIKKITNNLLLGFEITSQTEGTCVLENVSEPSEEKFETLLRRIFLIIKETQSLISKDFEKSKYENYEKAVEYKEQLDKFVLFCRRITAKEKNTKDPIITWELLTFLTHIQHAQIYMYEYASTNKIHSDKTMINLIRELREYFDIYYDSYFKKDIKGVHKINKLRSNLHFGQCIELLEKSRGKNTVIYSYMREIFRLIQIGTSPILSGIIEEKL